MQIISQFAPLPLAQPAKGTAVAMGYFDGIHIGHRAVIEGAVQWAKTHDAAPAVFTFRLPVENKMKGKRLLSTEDKHALIHSLGVEYYLTPDFEAIKALSPEEFVRGIVENCHARALFCGENFTFGGAARGRAGAHPRGAHHQPAVPAGLPDAPQRHLYHPHLYQRGVVSLGHRSGQPPDRER